jgi:hypothetical protein
MRALVAHGVHFIVIGGVAARLHGSDQLTADLDVAYERSRDNIDRLVVALNDLGAVRVTSGELTSAPTADGFEHRIEQFVCEIGNIDAFAVVRRVGDFDRLEPTAEPVEISPGVTVLVADIESLIWWKSGSGRPNDATHVRSLERVRDERRGVPPSRQA